MSWFLYIVFFALLLYVVSKWKFFALPDISKQLILIAFVVKVWAGFGITLLYTYYYTDRENSDIYKYFDDGLFLNSLFYTKPLLFLQLLGEVNIDTPDVVAQIKGFNHWDPKVRSYLYNDSRFIIKLNALLSFVSLGNVYIHSLFASFFGFIGLTAFVKALRVMLQDATDSKNSTKIFAILLFFFPSILMWGSAMLKETILVLVFGLFLWWLVRVKHNFQKIPFWLVLILLVVLLAIFKVYVLLSFVLGVMFFFSSAFIKTQWKLGVWAVVFVIAVLLFAVSVDYFLLHQSVLAGIEKKQWDSIRLAQYMKAGSFVFIPAVKASNLWTFAQVIPFALWNVMCAPMIWNATSLMLLPLATENLLLFFLLLVVVFNFRKMSLHETRILFGVMVFCFFLFAVIGITTPVLGSIVRYRVPGIILLLMPVAIALQRLVYHSKKN